VDGAASFSRPWRLGKVWETKLSRDFRSCFDLSGIGFLRVHACGDRIDCGSYCTPPLLVAVQNKARLAEESLHAGLECVGSGTHSMRVCSGLETRSSMDRIGGQLWGDWDTSDCQPFEVLEVLVMVLAPEWNDAL
jgi:hypothetical protein